MADLCVVRRIERSFISVAVSVSLALYLVAHFDAAPSHCSSSTMEQVLKLEMSNISRAFIATVFITDSTLNKDSPRPVFLAKKSLGFPASFSLLIPTTSLVS